MPFPLVSLIMYNIPYIINTINNAINASAANKRNEDTLEYQRGRDTRNEKMQVTQMKLSYIQHQDNKAFQAEQAALSFERQKELETFRQEVQLAIADKNLEFQRWRLEQEKALQAQLANYNRETQLLIARYQRKTAIDLPEVNKLFETWPLRIVPLQILNSHQTDARSPIRVIIAPPDIDFDKFGAGDRGVPKLEKRLAEGLRQFFSKYYPLNDVTRPIEFLDGAWDSKRFHGGSSIKSLFGMLRSESVLVLESEIDGEYLNFRFGYWAAGQQIYSYTSVISNFKYGDLVYESAKARARKWKTQRDLLSQQGRNPKAINELDTHNLEILEEEECLAKNGADISQFPSRYKIKNEDFEALSQFLSINHFLVTGVIADVHYLLYYDVPPILPQYLPEYIQDGANQEIIQLLVECYQKILQVIENERSAWVPDLALDLANSLTHLPEKTWAKGLLVYSLETWLKVRGLTEGTGLDDLLKAIIANLILADEGYVEKLLQCLIALGENSHAETLSHGWEEVKCREPKQRGDPKQSDTQQQEEINESKLQTFVEKKMSNQQQGINLDATEVRNKFANYLQGMVDTLAQAEERGKKASGELAFKPFTDKLNFEIKKLRDAKFRFLVIGDFNRGKSSILNVLLGQENLLPVGATATTAIPTFVKYGEEKKVSVHLKNGNVEELSVEEYKKKYTLNSKEVKDKIKRFFNSVGEWLNPLDYADFYCPAELLSNGVEFIDTAGLNHTPEEDQKTFDYIKDSHAIIFVLSAEQQLTDREKSYLTTVIKDRVSIVFFLINKWEMIDEENGKEEIHGVFVEGLSESLGIKEDEVGRMWDNRIFDIYARNALDKLKNQGSLNETGFLEFTEKLNSFLINERLSSELFSSVQTAGDVANSVVGNISDILLVLGDDLKTLEEKIKKVNPHIKLMKKIVKYLASEIKQKKDHCSSLVAESYKSYFLKRSNNFEREFTMPEVSGLSDRDKSKYMTELGHLLTNYQQEKLKEWNQLNQFNVIQVQNELRNQLDEEISSYQKEREEIREILNENSKQIQNQGELLTSESGFVGETNLTKNNANATGKIIGGLAGGAVGTMAVGIGAATAANALLGTHIVIGIIGAGLTLTPVGWVLLGVSGVVGGALAWWGRNSEVDNFQKGMQQQLKDNLQRTATDEEQISAIKNHIQSLFIGFEKVNQQLSDDVESLEQSLNNLLESKRQNKTNYETEETRLKSLSENISAQWETINVEYTKIATISS